MELESGEGEEANQCSPGEDSDCPAKKTLNIIVQEIGSLQGVLLKGVT